MKLRKGIAVAAFSAAVVGPLAGAAVYEFVPPFNGSQPFSAWQASATLEVASEVPVVGGDIVDIPDSARPDGATGVYDGKLMDFTVTNSSGFVKAKAEVQCDQARVDGFRGGNITCKTISLNLFSPNS